MVNFTFKSMNVCHTKEKKRLSKHQNKDLTKGTFQKDSKQTGFSYAKSLRYRKIWIYLDI